MIEFNGLLTGKAKDFLLRRQRKITCGTCVSLMFVFLPISFSVAVIVENHLIFAVCILLFLLSFLTYFLPVSRYTQKNIMTQKIIISQDCITNITQKHSESNLIKDVKKIYDHGEFYEFKFPLLKSNYKFLCQKDLISQGTLDDFEELFKGKIKRV